MPTPSLVRRHLGRRLFASLLVAALVGGLAVAAEPDPTPAVAATAFRHYGGGPLDSIMAMATKYAKPTTSCGLSVNRLAAMMMVPTFPESGSTSGRTSPSPMTLSRWDTQTALWAFGNKATQYQGAFFHPGVGMWQFDSAGGWPLTAGDAINTLRAAEEAAKTISSGYCNSSSTDVVTKMRAGWFAWFECHSGTLCLDYLDSIFDGTNLLVIRDDSIGALGGAENRICTVGGIGTVACTFVDPARAQGDADFAMQPRNGVPPTPISKPFYVFSANNKEYRYWQRADTGYDVNIIASKPLTANARTSLTWSTAESTGAWICDQTAVKGACAPFGAIDSVTTGVGSVITSGWAIDPGQTAPTAVHVYVDGVGYALTASDPRPDVAAAYPTYGAAHGFSKTVTGLAPGAHTVCSYAIDSSVPFNQNTLLGCSTVTVVTGSPIGSTPAITPMPNGVVVSGWAFDPDTYTPIGVTVTVDGLAVASGVANLTDPGSATSYPAWGSSHGFSISAGNLASGPRLVCVTAANVGGGATTSLGCRTVVIGNGSPIGYVESWSSSFGQVRASGWTIDPDTYAPITAGVYVDGILYWLASADAGHAGVGIVYPAWGTPHGFSATITGLAAGNHSVCVKSFNVGGGANATLGCNTLNVPAVAPSNNPIGWVNSWGAGIGTISAGGWTIDPNTFSPISVRVVVDGLTRSTLVADAGNAAVGQVYPAWGTPHGFNTTITGLAPGSHYVCVEAINAGPGIDSSIGCKWLGVASATPANDPFGWVNAWSTGPGSVSMSGWMIDPDTYAPINAVVFVDGVARLVAVADAGNASVGQVYPAWGTPHGFNLTVNGITPGSHAVCVYAVNVGAGTHTQTECRTITV